MPFPSNVAGGQPILASWGNSVVESLPQIGSMQMWAGDTAPPNWLLCRGQAVSRATYTALFTIVGVRFGPGDGTSTFNLPDMRGRYPVGYNQGGSYFTLGVGERFGNKDSVLPAHQHAGVDHLHPVNGQTGNEQQAHDHGFPEGYFFHATANPQFYLSTEPPNGFLAADIFNFADWGTGGERQPHNHRVDIWSGAADRSLTTGVAGGDGTNGNLPPSVSLNYVLRAL